MIIDLTFAVLQAVMMIGLAPLFTGVLRKTKARMQNRKGNSVLQPYRDLVKLFKKDESISKDTSVLFRIIPYVCLSSMFALAFIIPFFSVRPLFPMLI